MTTHRSNQKQTTRSFGRH